MIKHRTLEFYERSSPFKTHLVTDTDDIDELFRTMSLDSKIAQKFSIRHSKMAYPGDLI